MRPESRHPGIYRNSWLSNGITGKSSGFPRLSYLLVRVQVPESREQPSGLFRPSHRPKRENSKKRKKMKKNKKVAATIRKWWNWLNYGSLPLKIYGWTIKSITTLQSIIDLIYSGRLHGLRGIKRLPEIASGFCPLQ